MAGMIVGIHGGTNNSITVSWEHAATYQLLAGGSQHLDVPGGHAELAQLGVVANGHSQALSGICTAFQLN